PHPDHFSSARDLSLLTAAIIRDQPEHFGYYAIREFTWNGITQKNRNPLLGRDETVDGVKTGHTSSAGYCLIGSSERKGMRLIGSVMGSRSNRERADSVYALLKFGFAAYESHDLYQAGARILSTGVFKGVVPEVNVGLADTVQLVLPKGSGAGLEAVIELVDPLVAPLVQGQQVGTLAITLGGEPLLTRPLVALAAVASGSWFDAMVDSVRLWFH
ncbi:MAG: serine-type D-Ala-D-Ala carboxypeptidase, partial [Arenicellales bacterium]|nr:serine-type D-Ala-D-Ala carboxypeptidase [Arenicellales bacterium]